MSATKTEIFVRFESEKHGSGLFEAPCHSIEEAAGQFAQDPDSISAMAIELGPKGRMISASDVTDQVFEHLKEMIRDDTWTVSPHPALDAFFSDWSEVAEQARAEDREHERVESAMLNI